MMWKAGRNSLSIVSQFTRCRTHGCIVTLRSRTASFATQTRPVQQHAATAVQESDDIDAHDFLLSLDSRSTNKTTTKTAEAPSDPSGTTGQISRWVHETTIQDIEPRILERAKYIILDGLACALTAAQLPESRVAAKSIFSMESPGSCTVIGWNKRLSPLPAALLNSTFIQGFELDDVHREAPWHANSIILPALFAAIQHSPDGNSQSGRHTGASFLTSAIVGFELGGRIGRSLSGKEMLSRGWHSGAVFGPAAAAAAVSRQLGLSARQIEDAMGTASTQACGLMSAQYEAMAKRMQHGFAARNGLFSALTARDNYTGIDKVFERPYGGYLAVFSQGSQKDDGLETRERALTQNLGTDYTAFEGISIKPYASMVGTHGAIDCISSLQRQHPERLSSPTTQKSIKKITVELNKSWYHHSGQEITRPITVIGAQMSTKYCVAAQLIDNDVLAQQFSSKKLNRDAIWSLIDRTTCEHNTELDAGEEGANPTRLTIEFDDGSSLQEKTDRPSTTASPMSNENIVEKWRALAASVIDEERMLEIEELVLNLERLDDVTPLIELLAAETRCPVE